MNERDSEALASMLHNQGYAITEKESESEIILINTCSVRDMAEQRAIGKAGHISNNPRRKKKIVGILGCMAQNKGQELFNVLPNLDMVIGTQKIHHIPHYLSQITSSKNATKIIDVEEENASQNAIRDHSLDKNKVSGFVSIMQGCNMHCAFCIVPYTRGQERSRPIDDIVTEVQQLADQGTKEVMLLGQIVTSYGRRSIPFENKQSPFVQLLHKIHEIHGIERIRFMSPHPCGFKDDLIDAYKNLPKVMPYVHFPLQSGSDKILRAMNRPYTQQSFLRTVEKLKTAVPDIAFSTDIIVGFPGETDEDFKETSKVFEIVSFDMAYIFKYSIRSGTPAAIMPDQIPEDIKESRNQHLLDLLSKASLARNNSYLNTTQQVLVEGPAKRGDNIYVGRNPTFRKVLFPGKPSFIGKIIPIPISRSTVSAIYGQTIEG